MLLGYKPKVITTEKLRFPGSKKEYKICLMGYPMEYSTMRGWFKHKVNLKW